MRQTDPEKTLRKRLTTPRYSRLDFALFLLLALVLMVFGFRSSVFWWCASARRLVETLAESPLPAVQITTGDASASKSILRGKYEFTVDWFSSKIPVWEVALAHFKGMPDVSYLEIGLYEGRSAVWMLENILTHPSSRLTGVDPFLGDYKDRCFSNIERSGASHRTTLITGFSQTVLRTLPTDSFNIIYIDGSHATSDVLEDAVLAWGLLKEGGILIFDDYRWVGLGSPCSSDAPTDLPKVAIDSFARCFSGRFNTIHNSNQLIIERR